MSKRLQVLLDAKEYKSFQQLAKEAGLSLGEWVRQTLRQVARGFSQKNPAEKLKSIRHFSHLEFPSGDIGEILSDIEKGRSNG